MRLVTTSGLRWALFVGVTSLFDGVIVVFVVKLCFHLHPDTLTSSLDRFFALALLTACLIRRAQVACFNDKTLLRI